MHYSLLEVESGSPAVARRLRVFLSSKAILAFAVLCGWLTVKCVLFVRLAYTSDMFSLLQMSLSWLDGRPLLWENCFGNHARLHDYYSVLAFAPLTFTFGAYGLFAGYL